MNKILLFVGCLLATTQVYATDVAVINLEEVIKNSIAMSKVSKKLETKKTDIEKKLKLDEKKLTDEKSIVEGQIKTLSQDVAQEKVMAFQQKVMDFQKKVKESETTLQKDYMNAVMEVTNTIKSILTDMKAEKNDKYKFDLVVPLASVIYSDNNLDISTEVLSRLNKKLKDIKSVK